jgi:hypothetical protein
MKKIGIIVVVIIVLGLGYLILPTFLYHSTLPSKDDKVLNSGVFGQVILGPICPAIKEGDDSCKDTTYKTDIEVTFQKTGGDKAYLFDTIETDEQGKYNIMLPIRLDGSYGLHAVGEQPYPRCETQSVRVEQDKILEIDILCDTGIRTPEIPLN